MTYRLGIFLRDFGYKRPYPYPFWMLYFSAIVTGGTAKTCMHPRLPGWHSVREKGDCNTKAKEVTTIKSRMILRFTGDRQ